MNNVLRLAGQTVHPRPSGALWWPEKRLLCVSDLHLGKAERHARRGGGLLPPYECDDTLERLETEIGALHPERVICLGDSFDDCEAAGALNEAQRQRLAVMMEGRDWIWIEGNHDQGPLPCAGRQRAELLLDRLTFRHIAEPENKPGEISGHYHPKARVGGARRACFLADVRRIILPAFGTYTGGMDITEPPLRDLMGPGARAVLTGPTPVAVPIGFT